MANEKLATTRHLSAVIAALFLLLPAPNSAAESKEKAPLEKASPEKALPEKAPPAKPQASKLVEKIGEKIGELGSNSASAFYYISAMSLLRSGKFAQALSEFNKACEFCPTNSVCLSGRAMCYLAMDEYQKCVDDSNQAIKFGDTNASCYKTRGRAFYELKDYSKCIADLSEAIRKDPDDSNTYLLRAFSYVANNDVEKSREDKERAFQLEPLLEAKYSKFFNETFAACKAIQSATDSTPPIAPVADAGVEKVRTTEKTKAHAIHSKKNAIQPKPAEQVPAIVVSQEPAKAMPAHSVETFSGGALTIKAFDKAGNPIPQE